MSFGATLSPSLANCDNTWPTDLFSRFAIALAASSTSSSISRVVRTHQMLEHPLAPELWRFQLKASWSPLRPWSGWEGGYGFFACATA